jgi:prevent-host-death family protein
MRRKSSYSVAEARAHLPAILNEIDAGEDVYLTRRGRPAAVVLSPQRFEALRDGRPTFAEAYERFLSARGQSTAKVERAFFTSLRDRSPGRRVRL